MNIKEAKEYIEDTVKLYLKKDEYGDYRIPVVRQRPIFLLGAPGIGKTAIMEQVASKLGIALVSYSMTHHTRQSALGLPFIDKKEYGGKTVSVSEYTMSEIIASVYDQIETSGVQEGILFLDEINCVSETLAPTMLQFLQYKTFGTHRVPDGFIIVTAGNPPQYNKSVRDFDIVTLDRLRRIDIEEDLAAFREYASRVGIHGSIMAYLGIRSNHFYSIRTEVEGRHFVTARGWEDLSRTIQVHEKRSLPVDEGLAVQFLQDPEIARSFAAYYDLYKKYKDIYRIPDILAGRFFAEEGLMDPSSEKAGVGGKEASPAASGQPRREILLLDPVRVQEMKDAPFDEKLSLITLLIDALSRSFADCAADREVQELIMREMAGVRRALRLAEDDENASNSRNLAADLISESATKILRTLRKKKDAGIPVSREEERVQRLACRAMDDFAAALREKAAEGGKAPDDSSAGFSPRAQYGLIRDWFSRREAQRQESVRSADAQLTNTFRFLSQVYGEGQEMVLFLTELSAGYYSLRFLNEHGNESYFRYNRLLLLRDHTNALRDEVIRLMD